MAKDFQFTLQAWSYGMIFLMALSLSTMVYYVLTGSELALLGWLVSLCFLPFL